MEMSGRGKEEWFRTFPGLPHGILSHDTPGDVFSRLDPGQFQECFIDWTRAVAALMPGEVVAVAGRPVLSEAEGTVRRPHRPGCAGAGGPPGQRLGLS